MKKLNKFYKRLHSRQSGFTLIELLVVIAILGVLAAIIVPNVSRFIGSGNQAAADVDLHNVQTAVTSAMAVAKVGELGTTNTTLGTGMVLNAPGASPAAASIDSTHNLTITYKNPNGTDNTTSVSDFITGGLSKLGSTQYAVFTDGSVTPVP